MQSSSIPDHAAGVAVGHGVPPVSESQPQQGVHSIPISLPFSHWLQMYEAYQINSTAILDALKSDVATHLRIEREAPWIQALTIAFVPFEPPHAQLCIPPGSMDAMVLNDVQLAALRPVAPKRTIGVLNEMLPQNSSNVAGPRHSNPNDERLHHATSSPRKRSYTASSHVDAYAPPSFLTNANAHRIRGLTSGKLRTHSIGESAASHHLGSTTSPRVKSARGKPRYGVMSTPASPNAARAPRHHVYPHDAASYANSAGYESMPTPGISSTTSPMNPQQTEQQKRARLPDSLQFLADGNLFDRLQGEQWMKRFASTTTNEDSVDVTSHVGGPASSQTSGLIVHLERKEHHPSAQSQHNHSERTGSPLRVPGHPDASTPVLLIGHALDTSRLSLIHNMGQSRRRLVAEHLRNDIIEHFRGDVPLWPQDIELKIDQSGVYLALFGLPSSLIAGNGSYDTVLQTLQYKAYLPVRLVNLTAMLDRQGATHSGTRDSSTTLTSFVYPPGSEPAESITAGLDRPRPCVIERPAVQGSAWLDETTTTLPNQKELTIPVSIQLPGKYMQALNLLDRRQLDLLCIEAECDVRTHLELVQLDELLSSQKSVTVDPSVNLNALDATICIGSHATPEKYYAIRARLGENIPITRTDAMLERILQTGEGRSPNTAEGTDASQVDNSTIALTMRLSETHAVQLRLLQPPTIGMLREEARHDIHECLSRAGLGDAIPIHMIHVTPSMDIGAFDVDVHIPKSVRQTRFGQIQKVLSSEVAIPRTGTLLEQILRQQPQALRSPQRRSASRSKSVPRTRTTMIIPVTMRMTSMHSRALRGINSSQIAQLQAFTREDVHAHLTAHGLSNVIKHEHITVQPAPHLNALNVDVKLVAGTPESIHRRLREALAEAISIPRAGEHLGELLREKRQETLALQKENTGSFRSNRVVATASRTALPSDDADQDPSVQVRSARHSSRPGRTRSIEPSKFRKQQLQQQQQQQQQQVPPRKAPVPVFRQSPRKSYVSERKKSSREMPVRKSQSRAEKPRRKESVPAAAPSKEVVTHGSGKKMVKETPPRDLTPPQNRTPEETIPVPRAAPTTAPVQAISSRKSTPHETTFAPEPHPFPTLVQPPIEEINSTTQTLESRPARPVETQMPTVAENNALVMTDIKDFLKPNNTQVTVQPSILSQHSVQSTIASSVTSFVALDSFEAPISVVSRTSSYTPEFKPVLSSATSTMNSTNCVSRTMDSTFNQPTTGTINNSPRDYIPETNSLSRTSSTRTTMTQNLTDATTLEHQRKVDELLRNVSSSNFSHSNSINASGSFGAVNNEMVTSSMKLESSDVERYKQLLILNRDEIKKAIRCDVLVHVRGLPINLQAEDVIVADMESPFNIVVEVPIRSAITRRSKEQLRERILQPVTAIEVRKLLERI